MVSRGVFKRSLALVLVVLVVLVPSLPVGGTEPQAGGPPYHVEADAVGFITCAAAYDAFRGNERCAVMNPNSRDVFDFPLDARLTTLVVRLDVSQGVFGANEFQVAFHRPVGIPSASGPVPIVFTHVVDKDHAWPSWGDPQQTLTIGVRVSHEADLPQVAYQQKIDVCVGFFYNDAKVPDGYVPCADE